MTEVSYDELLQTLPSEALELLDAMTERHRRASKKRVFFDVSSMAGDELGFLGDDEPAMPFDSGALHELIRWALVARIPEPGTAQYQVTGQGLRFQGWVRQRAGTAVAQVDGAVRSFVMAPEFAAKFPGAARHLGEALSLLWSGETSITTISEIGDHLRKALMDLTTVLVGDDASGRQEQPIDRLKTYVAKLRLPERETAVLDAAVTFADKVLRLGHRLNHVRDELDKDEPPVGWEEARRACFATAFVSYELSRLSNLLS